MGKVDVNAILSSTFQLSVERITQLVGEQDANYRVRTTTGDTYLLKISDRATFDPAPVLRHLTAKALPFTTPRIIGQHPVDSVESGLRATLQTWVPGRLLDTVQPKTSALWKSWGRTCGLLSQALMDIDLPAAYREYAWDPLRTTAVSNSTQHFNQKKKILAEYFIDRIAKNDYTHLRHSVNYNDAHELNLLVGAEGTVTGVIDFGDVVYTATVCELAIACAYAGMGVADPLAVWRDVIAGYHGVYPLREEELDILYDLIASRLLLTVIAAARNRHTFPENDYLTVSETSAWKLLHQLRSIDPLLARAHFRVAAGLPAHPSSPAYHDWARTAKIHSVMDVQASTVKPLDLGVGSHTLGLNENFEHLPNFSTLLRRHLEDTGADIAVGGYGETRPVYTTDDFRAIGNDGPRWRSVHLGLDLWTRQSGDVVCCPLAGTVVGCGTDPTTGGYGATVILRHDPTPTLTFYTLYGHLDATSIRHLGAGTQVQGGEPLAVTGGENVNGGWPPHLHFQVMLELLGNSVDFPGVAYPEERAVWLGICPDPRTLIPHTLPTETHLSLHHANLAGRRKKSLGYSLSLSYDRPLTVLRGARQYLYDHHARRYLDTVNNVAHVGHQHPRVVKAAQRQSAVLNTNSRYLHPTLLAFADTLLATLPDTLEVVHLVNSGSEANELALRMAEAYTGSRRTLALDVGYHGNTARTIGVSAYKFDGKGGAGRPVDTHILPLPDTLRGRHLDPTPYLPEGTLTFLHESVPSCGGQVVLPPDYLRKVYARIRHRGGLCIADEVQTGLGRLGSHYWAFETQGVVPDIVTIGKPLGNGHPLGAVVCTAEVARAFANGMEYFNTFGGNPVSAAVGLAVLRTVADEGLREHALATGEYLKKLLNQLATRHPLLIDVRGSGFFLGVELGTATLAPAAPPARYVMNRMRELGFLMGTDGRHNNVLKIKPPMCFTRQNAELLTDYLDRVLREDGSRLTDE